MKLNADEYEKYYRGAAHNIIVKTHQGVRVQFPAAAVRSFVTPEGILGNFIITMDSDNKLINLQKLIT